jgi:hypothetical protein
VKDRLVFNAVLHDTEVETYTAANHAATSSAAATAASVALLVLAKLVSPSKGFGTVVTLQKIKHINTFFLSERYRRTRLDWAVSRMVRQVLLN